MLYLFFDSVFPVFELSGKFLSSMLIQYFSGIFSSLGFPLLFMLSEDVMHKEINLLKIGNELS